jgi:hypothetical protein
MCDVSNVECVVDLFFFDLFCYIAVFVSLYAYDLREYGGIHFLSFKGWDEVGKFIFYVIKVLS